jgi:uncharacterized repeat protein (TIGR03803 family)
VFEDRTLLSAQIIAPTTVGANPNNPTLFVGPNVITVSDPGGINEDLALSVSHGILNLANTAGLTVSGNGTNSVTASGALGNLNADLASLSYTPASGYNGDTLSVFDQSDDGLSAAVTVAITDALNFDGPNWVVPAAGDVDAMADPSGNVYVVGSAVVEKFDPTGNVLWSQQLGPTMTASDCYATATGVYVAGGAAGSAFLQSYDAAGNLLWTREFGGDTNNNATAFGVAANATGVYVGGTIFNRPSSTASAFLDAYDPNGNLLWTSTPSGANVSAVAADAGRVYAFGDNGGGPNVYLTAYDTTSGNEAWGTQIGTRADDIASTVSVYGSAIYVGGGTTGSFPGTSNSGGAYVAQFDTSGNLSWIREFGSAGDSVSDSAANPAGVFVVGTLNGNDFSQQYDPSGTLVASGPYGDNGVAVSSDGVYVTGTSGGSAYLAAFPPAQFDQATPTVTVADAGGTYDGESFAATATAVGTDGVTPVSGTFAFTYYIGSTVNGAGSTTAPTDAGTYTVVASFASEDPNYGNAQSAPATFTVSPASPTISTTAGGTAVLGSGTPLTDSATLSGGYNETGSITFTLYAPDGSTVVDSETVTVSGNGTYNTPNGYVPTSTGTYQWVASYSGDANNNSAISSTPTLTTLATFDGSNGANPVSAFIMDSSGNLYGTTIRGGVSDGDAGYGTIFELAQGSNTITTLALFDGANGAYPVGRLVMDSSGNLYGATDQGGAHNVGTIFELAHGSSTISTLASFDGTNGAYPYPYSGLIMDSSGNLYGTTWQGGADNDGTIFELAQGSSTITTLASFDGTNGAAPYAGLLKDSAGNLYGTTTVGGADNDGTIFKLAQGSSTITALASFDGTNGSNPYAALVMDSSGNLYGTAVLGGADGDGTIFELAQGSSTITALASFDGTNGAYPYATLIMDRSGNLYGTADIGGANNDGAIFELARGSSTITTLASFDGTNGPLVYAGLLMDSSGNLYGMTAEGGADGDGVIFELAGSEREMVSPASPTLNTTAGGTIVLGSSTPLTDSATLSGGYNETGSITFTLYAPDGSTVVDSETVNVSGDGTYNTPTGYVPIAMGTYEWVASYTGDGNNNPVATTEGSEPESVIATPTVTVSDAGGPYTGTPYSATATVAGVDNTPSGSLEGVPVTLTYYAANGTQLAGAPVAVGTYRVVASFAGSQDYTSASQSLTFNITAATPTVSVSDSGTYDGEALSATATVAGVVPNVDTTPSSELEGMAPVLTYFVGTGTGGALLPGPPSTAGTYTVEASFPGSADYAAASSTTTFVIGQATPVVTVSDVGGTYNGNPFAAAAAVAGVVPGIDNTPSSTLEGVGLTLLYFDGAGTSGAQLPGPPTTAGTYTVEASFPGSADYAAASITTTFVIAQATPVVTVSDVSGPCTGSAFNATATVAGVVPGVDNTPSSTLESVGRTLSYYVGTGTGGAQLSEAPTTPGTYTVVATFPGSQDYTSASNSTTFGIELARPAISETPGGIVTLVSGARMTDSATLSGGVNPTGTITFTLFASDGTTVLDTEATPVNGDGTYTTPTGYLPKAVGTYQWSVSYSGDSLNNPASLAVLYSGLSTLGVFNGANGSTPESGVIVDGAGHLFGTTSAGGSGLDGTLFELSQGTISTLVNFGGNDGELPAAGLIRDSAGNLYGTTKVGGAGDGTVFEFSPGTRNLNWFNFDGVHGANPSGSLIMDAAGNLYGTTASGGAYGDGTVFEWESTVIFGVRYSTIVTLASFDGGDGANPVGSLIMDSAGNLYGTTENGGANGMGTVFGLENGTITTLASFNGRNGSNPEAGLIMDSAGSLYGTTPTGGADGAGAIFELPRGTSTIVTLASFNGSNGGNPNGSNGSNPLGSLTMDSAGDLFGTTEADGHNFDGTVFELAQGSSTITTLSYFDGADGAHPFAGLTMDSAGNLYGTTTFYLVFTNVNGEIFTQDYDGSIFELTRLPNTQPETVVKAFPPSIAAPQMVSVNQNGTLALKSGNSISVTDPSGTAEQLTLSVGQGTLKLGTTTGLTVTGNGTASMSLSGSLASLNADLASLTYKPKTGFYGGDALSLTDTDTADGFSGSATVAIGVDRAPAITSPNHATFTVGTNGSFTVTATGFPPPNFSESGALPNGVTLNASSGVLSGTPAPGTGGTYPITFTASNGIGTPATQTFTLTVDQAPAITSAATATFTVGTAGSFTVTDTGFPKPTLSLTGTLSAGITFNATTGVLSGTPAAGKGGVYNLTFTASNVAGSARQNFELIVDQAPAITSAKTATFTVGSAGTFTVTTSGYPTANLTESGALPGGVSFNPSTGILSGTPVAGSGGKYSVTFMASNGVGVTASQTFTLTVNQAPAITSANTATFIVGTAGSFSVTTTGFPAPTLSRTGTLPAGITFDATTGVLSGTPTKAGTYTLTFTATNGVGSKATQTFALIVEPHPAASGAAIAGPSSEDASLDDPSQWSGFNAAMEVLNG